MRLLNRDRDVVSMGGDCGDLEGGWHVMTHSPGCHDNMSVVVVLMGVVYSASVGDCRLLK